MNQLNIARQCRTCILQATLILAKQIKLFIQKISITSMKGVTEK